MDILTKLYFPFVWFKGIKSTPSLKLRGRPIIYKHKLANIRLSDNVSLNSRKKHYHGHMHSPVKLLADMPGAIIEIGEETRINGACIHAKKNIKIGERCLIASGVQILDSNGHELSMNCPTERINSIDIGTPILIGDDVWIGMNSIILPGTVIGSGSIIGANTVVSGNIPERSILKSTYEISAYKDK